MKPTAEKPNTLNLNAQFTRLYKSGVSCVRPTRVLYARKNGLMRNRWGITVSKKIGKAHLRNRAKRRMRAIARENSGILKPGLDFVLVARSRTVTGEYSALMRDFEVAAEKVGVKKDD